MISLRCLYTFASSGLLAESQSLSTLFLPNRRPMTSTSGSVMRSKEFFLEILGWNSRRLLLLMLMSFFSSSLRVCAASASMLDPLAAVMAYLRVTLRKSSPYSSTKRSPTPTIAVKSSAFVGTRCAISLSASSGQTVGMRPLDILRSSLRFSLSSYSSS